MQECMHCILQRLKTGTRLYPVFPGIKFNLIIARLLKGYDCFSTTRPPVWAAGKVPPDSLWHYHQPPEPEGDNTHTGEQSAVT